MWGLWLWKGLLTIISWNAKKIHWISVKLFQMFLFVWSSSFSVKGPTPFGWHSDTDHAKFYAVHVRWGRNKPLKDNRLLFKVHDLPLWLCWFVRDRPVCCNMCFMFSYLNKEFCSVALQPESFYCLLKESLHKHCLVKFWQEVKAIAA